MSRLPTFLKDPDSQLDFGVDWSEWLEEGDTISNSVWEVDDAALVIVDASVFSSTKTVVWLSGGVAGTTYTVTNRITTAGAAHPRIVDRSFRVRVRER